MLGLSADIAASKTIRNMHQQNYLNFNGTDEYIDIDNIAGARIDGVSFSISAWFKFTGAVTSGRHIFKMEVDTNNIIQLFYHASANNMRFSRKAGGTTSLSTSDGAIVSVETDGAWHHVAGTINTDADEVKFYLDGTLKETVGLSGTWSGTSDGAQIGYNGSGNYWYGGLDEIAIWNRAITADEVTAINSAGVTDPVDMTGGYKENLLAYYRLEEKGGSVAFNYADPSKNGTIVNSPTVNSH